MDELVRSSRDPAGPRHRKAGAAGFRRDVQGLRAIAVGLVVVYHLYPTKVPGGFIGVDVFFVISGFLITAHLANTFKRDGRVRLLDFYARRARRLLPAAAVVLAAIWLASKWLLPVTQLPATAEQVRASALYFQNWVLARDSVDYLAQENSPSPAQHFWSLSVEEQFYVVWPLLFVLGAAVVWLARRASDGAGVAAGRRTVIALAFAVVVASLVYSITETANNPAAAYFITPTRMWELALGGLLALLPAGAARRIGRVGLLAWAGLAAVVGSAFYLSTASAFPGWVALIPVGGAALLLAAGSADADYGTSWLTSSRPFVFIGDISYSLYLWHWPIIVLWLAYSGGRVGPIDGPILLAAAILLSWLTKIFVEDPFRRAKLFTRRPAFSLAAVATVLVPVLLVALTAPATGKKFTGRLGAANPGAAALDTKPTATPAPDGYLPPLVDVPKDLPLTSSNGCQADTYETKVKQCVFGDTTAPTRTVALVGDSHAGQWSSALDRIGREQHWKFVAVLHVGCRFGSTMTVLYGKPFTACYRWGVDALRTLTTTIKPDSVIMADRPSLGTPEHPNPDRVSWGQIGRGIADYTSRLLKAGIKVVAIQETPEPGKNSADCLAARDGSVESCSTPASKAILENTPMDAARKELGIRLPVVDMNDLLCTETVCPPVVGNVVVYRDKQHLGKTYTLTMAPYLKQRLIRTGAFD